MLQNLTFSKTKTMPNSEVMLCVRTGAFILFMQRLKHQKAINVDIGES
jgi:hypothetical protein